MPFVLSGGERDQNQYALLCSSQPLQSAALREVV